MDNNRNLYRLAVIAFFAVIAVYANHFNNGFHFDDSHSIVNNIYIKDIGNIPSFFRDSTLSTSLPANQAYRPLVTASTAVDYWLGNGLYPFYFHLSTFVLFIVQGIFMYFLYLKIFDLSYKHERNKYMALFGTVWYLLHPANAETINYILARSDSISTLFVVVAFVAFLYSSRCRRWHLYLIPVALGSLAKPTAIMFGPLLFTYVLLFEEKTDLSGIFLKKNRARLIASMKTASVALGFCVLLFAFIRFMDSPTWVPGGTSRFHYLITQPYVLLHYFITFFLPISLSADTDWTTLGTLLDIRFIIGISFVVVLLYAAVLASKKEKLRPVSFGIFWFFISLIPTSSVIPLAEVMNDHRLFFPYVGLMMSVCWSLYVVFDKVTASHPSRRKLYRMAAIGLVVVCAAYAYGTFERNKVWRTNESLWRDVTEKSPKNGRGLMNYGVALMARADYADAEKYFSEALRLYPNYSTLFINMGILKAATGDPVEAEQYFRNAIAADPANPECYYFYARWLESVKRYDEAVQYLDNTLKLSSAHMNARYLLMAIFSERNEFGNLKVLAEQTLRIVPGDKQSAQYLSVLKIE